MIQVYKENNTDYSHNGDCVLMPTECYIEAELNGAWSASLTHPIDPEGRWNYLTAEAVVKMPSFLGNDQLFRIKKREKGLDEVYCKLEPIFFDSGGDCWLFNVRPIGKNGQQALDMMCAPNSKYSGESNIQSTATAYYQWKTLTEAISGDDENSFLNRWGGEILYDNFKVIINDRVGSDNGLEVRYAKNLQGISETVDMTDLITRIWPMTYCGHPMRIGYVTSPLEGNYPIPRQCTMTFDNIRYKDDITDEAKEIEEGRIVVHNQNEIDYALYNACMKEFAAGIDKPVITLDVDMILVGYTEQYEDLKGLENVSLGDTVYVIAENVNINAAMRVYKLEYDCIRERATNIKLGSEGYNYFKNTAKDIRITQAAVFDSQVQTAGVLDIANTTELNLAEVTNSDGETLTLAGDKLVGSNWHGTSKGIVFSEPATGAGTFRMVTEDGKVVFQAYNSTGEVWEDIGYLQRFTQTGDNVLGLVSAPNGDARIWIEDKDKFVWISSNGGTVYVHAKDGTVSIQGNDVVINNEKTNQQFHPFTVEQKQASTSSDYDYFTPPENCHYLIAAAAYRDDNKWWVKGFQNSGKPVAEGEANQWIVLYSSVPTGGYVTLIWI